MKIDLNDERVKKIDNYIVDKINDFYDDVEQRVDVSEEQRLELIEAYIKVGDYIIDKMQLKDVSYETRQMLIEACWIICKTYSPFDSAIISLLNKLDCDNESSHEGDEMMVRFIALQDVVKNVVSKPLLYRVGDNYCYVTVYKGEGSDNDYPAYIKKLLQCRDTFLFLTGLRLKELGRAITIPGWLYEDVNKPVVVRIEPDEVESGCGNGWEIDDLIDYFAGNDFSDHRVITDELGVDDGSVIFANFDVSEQYVEAEKKIRELNADGRFDDAQVAILRYCYANNIDVSKIADPRYNFDQMKIMLIGVRDGLDISAYANPEFGYLQMEEVREGLESGVDVSVYANPEFNWKQMARIREGLERGLDVSSYTDPMLTWKQMEDARLELEKAQREILADGESNSETESMNSF